MQWTLFLLYIYQPRLVVCDRAVTTTSHLGDTSRSTRWQFISFQYLFRICFRASDSTCSTAARVTSFRHSFVLIEKNKLNKKAVLSQGNHAMLLLISNIGYYSRCQLSEFSCMFLTHRLECSVGRLSRTVNGSFSTLFDLNSRLTYLLRHFDVTVKRPSLNISTLHVNLFGILTFVPFYCMFSFSNKSIVSAKDAITSSNAFS